MSISDDVEATIIRALSVPHSGLNPDEIVEACVRIAQVKHGKDAAGQASDYAMVHSKTYQAFSREVLPRFKRLHRDIVAKHGSLHAFCVEYAEDGVVEVILRAILTGRTNYNIDGFAHPVLAAACDFMDWPASELVGELDAYAEGIDDATPLDSFLFSELKKDVRETLRTLTPREAKITSMHFGIEVYEDMNYDEIGKCFGLTRERIRQIESKALRKLRHPSRTEKLRAYINLNAHDQRVFEEWKLQQRSKLLAEEIRQAEEYAEQQVGQLVQEANARVEKLRAEQYKVFHAKEKVLKQQEEARQEKERLRAEQLEREAKFTAWINKRKALKEAQSKALDARESVGTELYKTALVNDYDCVCTNDKQQSSDAFLQYRVKKNNAVVLEGDFWQAGLRQQKWIVEQTILDCVTLNKVKHKAITLKTFQGILFFYAWLKRNVKPNWVTHKRVESAQKYVDKHFRENPRWSKTTNDCVEAFVKNCTKPIDFVSPMGMYLVSDETPQTTAPVGAERVH